MDINQVSLSAESEEIVDKPKFSVFSLISLFLAGVGSFAFQYSQLMPLAIVGAILGAVCLLLSKKYKTGLLSNLIAGVAVAIGTIASSTGTFMQRLEIDYDLTHAKAIAETYLKSASAGDMDRLFILTGIAPDVDVRSQSNTDKITAAGLKKNPILAELSKQKQKHDWTFVSMTPGRAVSLMTLEYKDSANSDARRYKLSTRRTPRTKGSEKMVTRWYVDSIERASN
jgi:hypothetical protein